MTNFSFSTYYVLQSLACLSKGKTVFKVNISWPAAFSLNSELSSFISKHRKHWETLTIETVGFAYNLSKSQISKKSPVSFVGKS